MNLSVLITLARTEDGGRRSPILTKYRSLVRFRDGPDAYGMELSFPRPHVSPGGSARAEMWVWALHERPAVDQFDILEGNRVVGGGRVLIHPASRRSAIGVQAEASLRAFVASFAPHLSPEEIVRVVELVEVNEPDVAITELAWMLEAAGFHPDPELAAEFRRRAPEFPAADDWPPHFRRDQTT